MKRFVMGMAMFVLMFGGARAQTPNAYPLHLRITASTVTGRVSAKPGWADVGEYVTGHGEGVLTDAAGETRHIVFSYTNCSGGVITWDDVPVLSAKWVSPEVLTVKVAESGGFPRPRGVFLFADCPVHVIGVTAGGSK